MMDLNGSHLIYYLCVTFDMLPVSSPKCVILTESKEPTDGQKNVAPATHLIISKQM